MLVVYGKTDANAPRLHTDALFIDLRTRYALMVNGEPVPVTPGTYAEVSRVWKNGDRVRVSLDMRTRQTVQDPFVSFARDPLVLARDARLGEDVFGGRGRAAA